mmetsp:Transcript_13617/g.35019  ORF Transcript_13617/g.35019 Transcript_13617/m.35019 type:complete len:417 (-) Transcript_13617:115-1365(-)
MDPGGGDGDGPAEDTVPSTISGAWTAQTTRSPERQDSGKGPSESCLASLGDRLAARPTRLMGSSFSEMPPSAGAAAIDAEPRVQRQQRQRTRSSDFDRPLSAEFPMGRGRRELGRRQASSESRLSEFAASSDDGLEFGGRRSWSACDFRRHDLRALDGRLDGRPGSRGSLSSSLSSLTEALGGIEEAADENESDGDSEPDAKPTSRRFSMREEDVRKRRELELLKAQRRQQMQLRDPQRPPPVLSDVPPGRPRSTSLPEHRLHLMFPEAGKLSASPPTLPLGAAVSAEGVGLMSAVGETGAGSVAETGAGVGDGAGAVEGSTGPISPPHLRRPLDGIWAPGGPPSRRRSGSRDRDGSPTIRRSPLGAGSPVRVPHPSSGGSSRLRASVSPNPATSPPPPTTPAADADASGGVGKDA